MKNLMEQRICSSIQAGLNTDAVAMPDQPEGVQMFHRPPVDFDSSPANTNWLILALSSEYLLMPTNMMRCMCSRERCKSPHCVYAKHLPFSPPETLGVLIR